MNYKQYRGAKIIINNWVKVKEKERVVILSDELHTEEALYLKQATEESNGEAVVIVISSENPQKGEPCAIVSYAMLNAEAIIAATNFSITTTQLKKEAIENGARFLSLPLANNNGISLLECDFIQTELEEVENISKNMNKIIDKGETISVTTDLGTNIMFCIKDRLCEIFSGRCDKSGMSGSASFELYVPPVETLTKGKVILDASMGYLGKVKEPFEIDFENGHIVHIQDTEEGNILKEYIESFQDENMYTACEFGIGLNKNAKCVGNSYIEDESSYGTFHIGFGRNTALGGNHIAKGHFDIVIDKPTITVDGTVIMKSGVIVV